MKEIKSVGLTNARNAEHFQFHYDVLQVVTESFAADRGLSALRSSYAALFQKEDEAFVTARALSGTADVEQKDAARDELSIYVCLTVEAKRYSPVAAEREAAMRLYASISPYRQAHQRPYAENTALVTNMVADLQGDALAADVALLGLADAVTALKTANEEFNTVYAGRSDEKQGRESSEKMKTIRPQVDEAYRSLVAAINSLYQVNQLVTKDEEAATEMEEVIDKLNARILQFTQTLTARTTRQANKAKATRAE